MPALPGKKKDVLSEVFESLTPEQEEMLKEKIIQQIKEALLAGILIEHSSLRSQRE